ncbi:MAG: sigma-70 family RNA polymerase sigma factor [Acidobacteriota bacterium]
MIAALAPHPDPLDAPAHDADAASADLESIFRRHHGRVFGAAYRLVGNAQDAEDVVQTVFLRLLRRGDTLDLSPDPGAYLGRAAVNAALDLLRRRSRSRSIPLDDLDPIPGADAGSDPERRQASREMRRGLRQALLGLTDRSAEIFALRFFEGLGNKDIAELFNMTQSAVGVSLHRARNQVKKEIASFAGDASHAH